MKGTFLLTLSLLAAANGGDLNHTKWRLVEINGQRPDLPNGASATIAFDGTSYQLSACNFIAGQAYLKGEKLSLSRPVHPTRRACLPGLDVVDASFDSLIVGGLTVRIEADRLTLTGDRKEAWVLQKEPQPSKSATTKVIYVAASTKSCTAESRMNCLQVRDTEYAKWSLNHVSITGFDYVPGIEYKLRIKEDRVRHPAADEPSVAWFLDSVLEKKVVDVKATNDYRADAR